MSYLVHSIPNSMGKKWDGTDVTTLPNGARLKYLKDAVKKVVDMFRFV